MTGKSSPFCSDLLIGLVGVVLLLEFYFPLIVGQATLTHDNLVWNYPAFHFYFSQLSQGHLPIFNFYSRFGEPFVPIAAQMRLWDPISSFIGVILWKMTSPIIAFNLSRILICVAQSLGAYLLLRRHCQFFWTRWLLMLCLLFTSFFYLSFRADGVINQFMWTPWIALLLGDFKNESRQNYLKMAWLGCLIGASFQSYFFASTLLFILVFLTLSWLFDGWRPRRPRLGEAAALILPLLMMSALNLTIVYQAHGWMFPARTAFTNDINRFDEMRFRQALSVDRGLQTNSHQLQTEGSCLRFWNYIQAFSPWGNSAINPEDSYGDPSETPIYLGLIPLFLGFWGLCLTQSKQDLFWLNFTCIFFLLGLGQDLGLAPLLSKALPIFAYIRHWQFMVEFIQLGFLYFVVKGCDDVLQRF